jgi:S-adenosylmethionine:diacylglycerol 3-amino-3-carboxypropyl transferase
VSTPAPQAHWQNVYQTKRERDVSWFQESPAISLDLIRATGIGNDATIVDIGGGASRLVDALIAEGFKSVTVLDLSEKALATSRTRLGALGAHVSWVVADVTKWQPVQTYDLWHDRAAFHFLTEPGDQAAYADCVRKTVSPGRTRRYRNICARWTGALQRLAGRPSRRRVARRDARCIFQACREPAPRSSNAGRSHSAIPVQPLCARNG